MTRRQVRGTLAVPVLGVLGVLLFWGFSGLPPFGNFHGFYGQLLNHIAVPQRHTSNVVAAVVFDYRGFDTVGEEFIFLAAVIGVAMLLRANARSRRPAAPGPRIGRRSSGRVTRSEWPCSRWSVQSPSSACTS